MKYHDPIPDDILIEIFFLLPLKSLHRLKWVSKSWYSLITHQIFPKILPSPLLGVFYNSSMYLNYFHTTYESDPANHDNNLTHYDRYFTYVQDPKVNPLSLPFLSQYLRIIDRGNSWSRYPRIIGGCNGLLLCSSGGAFLVCNPSTTSWTQLPSMNFSWHDFMLLDFDPWVSPHFYVATISMRYWDCVKINIYCSETGRWEDKSVECRVCIAPALGHVHNQVFWNGSIYMYVCCGKFVNADESYKTIRFGISKGDVGYEFVGFPLGTKMPRKGVYIRRLGNKLSFADLDDLHLRLWTLQGKYANKWVLEHDSTICSLGEYHPETLPVVFGFHPLLEAVLIRWTGVIYAYDLKEMLLHKLCRIGPKVYDVHYVPYSPCSFDLLENRISTEEFLLLDDVEDPVIEHTSNRFDEGQTDSDYDYDSD